MTALTVDVERYRAEGYLTAPSVVSDGLLAELREEADRLMAICHADPDRYVDRIQWEVDYVEPTRRVTMDRVIRMIEPVVDLSEVFAGLATHPAITRHVSAIFGDGVVLFEDKLNLKLAGGSSYPWHQDWVCCWRAHSDELITCFIYLDDADAQNGCLQVIPRSHIGKPQLPFKPGSRFEIDPAYVSTGDAVAVTLSAGDIVYFDPYLLHHSDVNRSSVSRRAIIFTYNPARLGAINDRRFPAATQGEARRAPRVLT